MAEDVRLNSSQVSCRQRQVVTRETHTFSLIKVQSLVVLQLLSTPHSHTAKTADDRTSHSQSLMSLTSARVAGRQVSELRRDSDREVGTRGRERNDSHEKDAVKNATHREQQP